MQGMYTREDGGFRHDKYVGVNASVDVTQQYNQGLAVIWYYNGGDSEFFDHNSWMKPMEYNLWGVSTWWAFWHPDWRSGTWIVYYQC